MKKFLPLYTFVMLLIASGSTTLLAQCPEINCPTNIVMNTDSGTCGALITYVIPQGYDSCAKDSTIYSFTGTEEMFIVPANIYNINIEVWGAQGGANWASNTNFGGYASADFGVFPGDTFYIRVGEMPYGITGGYNGGGNGESDGQGGGGASDVRTSGNTLNDRIIVAGGGGGAGYWETMHVVGGVGGGLNGGDGYRDPDYITNPGGLGGTQSAGGANGTCVSLNNPALAGGFGFGGTMSSCGCEGYGGGGGWYGGAGSGNCRGGGGGSGYILPTATNDSTLAGVRVGHGQVIIRWSGTPLSTSMTSGLASGSIFPTGITTVTYKSTDLVGGEDSCSFTITIIDNEAPLADVTPLPDLTSPCSLSVTPPMATDNCSGSVVATTTDSLTYNSQGTYTIHWIYEDGNGNTSTQLQTVIINDTTSPLAPALADTSGDCSMSLEAPVAVDNCAGSITGTTTTTFPITTQGTTNVTWTFDDGNGNVSYAIQNVILADSIPPTFTCPTSSSLCQGETISIAPSGISDNCGGTITVTYLLSGVTSGTGTDDASTANFNIGTTNVNYTFTDENGNSSSCNFDLTIDTINVSVVQDNNTLTATGAGTYQWYNCTTSAIITGETSAAFIANNNGNYAVIITNGSCIDTSTCYLVDNIGLMENGSTSNILVYPNPSNGSVTIELPEDMSEVNISISDLTGRVMIRTTCNNKLTTIDLSNLSNGMYNLKLWNKDDYRVVKLLKN